MLKTKKTKGIKFEEDKIYHLVKEIGENKGREEDEVGTSSPEEHTKKREGKEHW